MRMYLKAECREWIRAAKQANWHKLPTTHPLSIANVADEQRRNLEAIEQSRLSTGRVPTWCDMDEYRECVAMLDAAS